MSQRYIVTIDIGTSSTKTALWGEAGNLECEASFAYSLDYPTPVGAQMDAEIWWTAVCTTIREVFHNSQIDPRAVAAIGVDGIGWTLVAVDASGNPLHAA